MAVNAAKYYNSIERTCMHYANMLSKFQIDYKDCINLKKQTELEVPLINARDNNWKVIKYCPIFTDCLSRAYDNHGPLVYFLHKIVIVPLDITEPLEPDNRFGESR